MRKAVRCSAALYSSQKDLKLKQKLSSKSNFSLLNLFIIVDYDKMRGKLAEGGKMLAVGHINLYLERAKKHLLISNLSSTIFHVSSSQRHQSDRWYSYFDKIYSQKPSALFT